MKKCKVITILSTEDSPLLIDTQDLRVWDETTCADAINQYLAQGYEVKQTMWDGCAIMRVYLEKDV